MALMELGDKIQNRKYEDYVLKNMKFIFDKTNQSYFHRLYDKTFREGGWRAVPRLTWHIFIETSAWMTTVLWGLV